MGALLDKPITEKHSDTAEGNGLRFGCSEVQGWRREMEDAHTVIATLPEVVNVKTRTKQCDGSRKGFICVCL